MDIYHLEDNLRNAADLADIMGAYWSARDTDPTPIGNHHFIALVYGSQQQAERVKQEWGVDYIQDVNDEGVTFFYSTVGITTDTAGLDGDLVVVYNYASDKKSIHEIAKESNTSWNVPDFDYEGHRIPIESSCLDFASLDEQIDAILERVTNFMAHYSVGDRVKYSVIDENCACFVNSVLSSCGYSPADRDELGEFAGVDWGEEDLIDAKFFDSNVVNGDTTRLALTLDLIEAPSGAREAMYDMLELLLWTKDDTVSTFWIKTDNSLRSSEVLAQRVAAKLSRIKQGLHILGIRHLVIVGKYDVLPFVEMPYQDAGSDG